MIKKQYALYDSTAMVFLNALTFQNDGEAIRWFTTQVNSGDEKNLITLYPEQYSLYRLMDYDDTTGKFLPRDMEQRKATKTEIKEADSTPKEIIIGVQVKEEAERKYTASDLIAALEVHFKNKSVIDISEEKLKREVN